MTADQLEIFRSSLQASLEQIELKTISFKKDLLTVSEVQPNLTRDLLDHAKQETDLNTQFELLSRVMKSKGQTRSALQRIAEGTFGLCVDCEENIHPLRLQACPTAPFCVPCQTQFEKELSQSRSLGVCVPQIF